MGRVREFVRSYFTLLAISIFVVIVVSIVFAVMFLPMIIAYLLNKPVTDTLVLIAEFLWMPIGAIIVIKMLECLID